MKAAYVAARAELMGIVGKELGEEVQRLVPAPRFGGHGTAQGVAEADWQDSVDFGNVRLELARLAGWIDGFIEEAQYAARMAAEAAAYAEARIKDERGIGFKPSK